MRHLIRHFFTGLAACFLLFHGAVFAQSKTIPGELIVMAEKGRHPVQLFAQSPVPLRPVRLLSRRLNIYLMAVEPGMEALVLEYGSALPGVVAMQYNHRVQARQSLATLPNDPLFNSQWALRNTGQSGGLPGADISAAQAWDLAQGGISAYGDTLVIAVIDDGFDLEHPDLPFWRNPGEIPGNGIDDDENGYTDDTIGWNAYAGNGQIPSNRHGTHVAGIAGARGDNGAGIAGVCWNARLMAVAGASTSEAVVIAAYGYVYEQRWRYDSTGGAEGAFVVVSNSSFGVNNGRPAQFPIWCALYDSLGAAGILNIVSTSNSSVNVDVAGDMPSTCTSAFLIAVTATNSQDRLHPGSAWGRTHIDLGAPGAGILSTVPGNYGQLSGTSMASPHAAGAVALMLSGSGPRFMAWYKNQPAGAALRLRQRLLAGVDTLPALTDSTSSNGRLNLFKAMQGMNRFADSLPVCSPPFALRAAVLSDSSAMLSWRSDTAAGAWRLRYRALQDSVWISFTASASFFSLRGLESCRVYAWQVAAACGGDSSLWTAPAYFETEGCCRAPRGIRQLSTSDTSTVVRWRPVYGAQAYEVAWQPVGDSLPPVYQAVTDTFVQLNGLRPCQSYRFFLRVQCGGAWATAAPIVLATQGCGFCTNAAYCIARSGDAKDDWIESVQIGPLARLSGNDGGYGNFTAAATPMRCGETYAYALQPGFSTSPFSEYWRIWMDLNQDGDFDDSGELLFDPGSTADSTLRGQLSIPERATPGITRLRVVMRFALPPEACGQFLFGEVEDYCVELDCNSSASPAENSPPILIYPNPAREWLYLKSDQPMREIRLSDLGGRLLRQAAPHSREAQLSLGGLAGGLYVVQVLTAGSRQCFRLVLQP